MAASGRRYNNVRPSDGHNELAMSMSYHMEVEILFKLGGSQIPSPWGGEPTMNISSIFRIHFREYFPEELYISSLRRSVHELLLESLLGILLRRIEIFRSQDSRRKYGREELNGL